MYIALEPFVRRSWSEMLISWNRIMAGDFRDPMIGRDILIGGLLGVGHALGIHIGLILGSNYLVNFNIIGDDFSTLVLNGSSGLAAESLDSLVGAVSMGLFYLFIAFLFYQITGNKRLGVLSIGILFFIVAGLFFVFSIHWVFSISAAIISICVIIALGRYGLLGVISFSYFFMPAWVFPVTFDSSLFYFPSSTLSIIITLSIVFCAAYISIAGQPIFGRNVLKEIE
jgi:serine/threonine-protein kinase